DRVRGARLEGGGPSLMAKTLLTYSDYAALPDDLQRYELHEGELFVTPAPGTRHQGVLMALSSRLYTHVRARGLGRVFAAPTDCILSNHTVVQPDIVYVAADRHAIVSERGIEAAPTLVVEILSPTTARVDLGRKRAIYQQYGVPWYWIVDADARTIDAFRLAASGYELTARLEGSPPIALAPFDALTLDPAEI